MPNRVPTNEIQYLSRPEGNLAYEVVGEGPLVVCIPGMGELRSSWRHTVPSLVEAGYRVATLDLRGHGDSDATFSRYDDVAAGEDALALVAELGGPAVLVGNSMGAGAAAWAAAEDPGSVAGLVLVGPFVRDPQVSAALQLLFRALVGGPWAPRAWTAYLPKLYPGRRPTDLDDHLVAIRRSMRPRGHRRAFTRTTRTSHAPVEARLPEVTAPTLVVMGERDPDFPDPAGEARFIATTLSGDLALVPEAGHYPQVEYPEVVNPRLLAFLARVAPRA